MAWVCRDRHQGRRGNGCKLRTIHEDELLEEIGKAIGTDVTEETACMVERVEVGMESVYVNSRQAG